ncbi:MAG: Ig-like domain-containing protein [candidate division Zixibacteria bacterium]
MRFTKTALTLGAAALMFLTTNCSDDDSVGPETTPGPRVTATYPTAGAIDIPTDTTISVTFDKAMDTVTISAGSLTLEGPGGTVNATVSFASDSSAILTPLGILAGHSVYTANIHAGVRDAAGHTMGVPYAWSFTTGSAQLMLYPDIEFTIRDTNGDTTPDELVGGGPPGRFLQSGVNGSQVDRAIMEFALDQIVPDSVLEALAIITLSECSVPYGLADIEAWGFAGNGTGEIADWNLGSRTIIYSDQEMNTGMSIAFPMTDMINAALDSNATHVGFRIAVTGQPVIEIATSGGANDDDKTRLIVIY